MPLIMKVQQQVDAPTNPPMEDAKPGNSHGAVQQGVGESDHGGAGNS